MVARPKRIRTSTPGDRRGRIVEIVGPVTGSVWGSIHPAAKPDNAALLLPYAAETSKRKHVMITTLTVL